MFYDDAVDRYRHVAPADRERGCFLISAETTLRYHACALTPANRIGILLVERVVTAPGVVVSRSQTPTGETFPNTRKGQRAANALMTERNVR